MPAGNTLGDGTGDVGVWPEGVGEGEGAGPLPPQADATVKHTTAIKYRWQGTTIVFVLIKFDLSGLTSVSVQHVGRSIEGEGNS